MVFRIFYHKIPYCRLFFRRNMRATIKKIFEVLPGKRYR
jgi:hypothetical protein